MNFHYFIKFVLLNITHYSRSNLINIKEKDNRISMNLIKKYPYKWNYWTLSKNPNIIEEFILKYPNKNWDIKYLINNNKITDFIILSKFKKITQGIINRYPNKPWDWEWLIKNTDINVEKYISFNLIEKYQYKWNYYLLSKNPNITKEFILKYPYKNWNKLYLIKNNKINNNNILNKIKNIIIMIQGIFYLIKNIKFKFEYNNGSIKLSIFQKFTEEFILKNLYFNWDIDYLIKNNKITNFKALSKFKDINQETIDKYPNKQWDWEWLIENTDISVEKYIQFDLIKKYPYKWNCQNLSKNPNITEDFILKYPYQNWNIKYLIKNDKITDFKALSKFKKINQYIIDEYPNKPWDWEWLIQNINVFT